MAEITEQHFTDAQSVIDGGGVAYVGGRTASSEEELDFIRAAVENEKGNVSIAVPGVNYNAFPGAVPVVDILSQPLTESDLMAKASGGADTSPKARAASRSQAQTGEADQNPGGTTGPVGDDKPADDKPADDKAPVIPLV